MRSAAASCAGLTLSLPPVVTLASQSALVLLCRANAAYCGRPLLSHPLMQQRMHALAAAADVVMLPLTIVLPPELAQATFRQMGGQGKPVALARAARCVSQLPAL